MIGHPPASTGLCHSSVLVIKALRTPLQCKNQLVKCFCCTPWAVAPNQSRVSVSSTAPCLPTITHYTIIHLPGTASATAQELNTDKPEGNFYQKMQEKAASPHWLCLFLTSCFVFTLLCNTTPEKPKKRAKVNAVQHSELCPEVTVHRRGSVWFIMVKH